MNEKKEHVICFNQNTLNLSFLLAFLFCVGAVLVPILTDIEYSTTGFSYAGYAIVAIRYLLVLIKKKDPNEPPELNIVEILRKQRKQK
jgi:hypothetical protein